ncbi:MFS transporter [Veillonella sp.]|jgi:DHA1 family multidrug resistance protein-like MFS transporter|uniref:MFS transporter n=2 Tax=Veillonella sp. TaxID=1926307 RepID=UPI001B6AAF33|nr:MFS transporter [Veillonella sp.]MBP8616647.1 MFS transporter [Veillonella sp.]
MNQQVHEDKQLGGMRNVWILSISMSILAICYTMITPFLPVYLLELGVEQDHVALWSGAVFGITFLIAGIMAPIWGKIADKHGKKRMALRAGFAIGIAYVIIGFVSNAWELLLGRAFLGFANGFFPAAMTMVSLSVNEKRVGQALGIFQTGLILGNIIGPFLGGAVESVVGMRPVFYVSGIAVIIATFMVLFLVKEPNISALPSKQLSADDENEAAKTAADLSKITKKGQTIAATVEHKKAVQKDTSIMGDFRHVQGQPILMQLVWLFFFMQFAIMMLQPILALYVGEMQGTMDNAAIVAGTILSIGGLAGAVTTNLWVCLGQNKGYFKTISFCLAGSGAVLLLQALPFGIWWFGALQILIGSFIVGVNPSLSAAVTLNTDPAFRGRMFGMTTTAQQFGSMIGPVFASVVSTYMGIAYVFGITGLLMLYLSYKTKMLSGAHDRVS